MAKTDPYERRHQANLRRYGQMIDEIFREAVNEAVRLSENADFDPTRAFSFDDYPILKQRLQELLSRLKNSLLTAIVNGVNSEWTLSNNKNNELSRRVFGDNIGRLTQEQYRRYFTNNDTAREAFLKRKEAGLDLSERVWKYAEQFKEDIELGLDVGIRDGLDAPSMSRELQQYLRRPDMLFRRVRDEHGTLHLSKRASEYHPGHGVYRSSYKNARRLAVTETNMAYRNADHERWQDMDFVVGIEIKLSNNHTCLGKDGKAHEFHDICDELQGKYPKDFKFTGWHPHCRCHAVSILMTDEEIRAGNRAILRGDEPPTESVNTVKDVPQGFKEWIEKNAARTAKAKAIPYFMRDNSKLVASIYHEKQPSAVLSKGKETLDDYMFLYEERDPKIAAIGSELSRNDITELEKAMLINQVKSLCAKYTFIDLKEAGVIDDTFVMSKIDSDFIVQEKTTLYSKSKKVDIPELKLDMVVFRDKNGKDFAYPVGSVGKLNVLMNATEASEVIKAFPDFLKEGIKRVSFYPKKCPVDKYWQIEYNNPKHVSAATDGGFTSFWLATKGMSKEQFMCYMSHEAGHILDSSRKISKSQEWNLAVKKDIELAKEKRGKVKEYPTDYAAVDNVEDFAESMSLFVTDRMYLKQVAPNREAFLHELTKKLGSIR